VETQQILVAFGVEDLGVALGNVWRITAKKTDFYLDPADHADGFHLSIHGPSKRYPDQHRFHVKVSEKGAASVKRDGAFLVHGLDPRGYQIDGKEIAPGAFLVARVRWRWDLQRPRFREAAVSGSLPDVPENASGAWLSKKLGPNDAADLDLVVSYDEPYWPNGEASERDNSRLGPLQNSAGMWLTATSYRRAQATFPAPEGLVPALPKRGEQPNRILACGPGENAPADIYWFVETMTSRELIVASQKHW